MATIFYLNTTDAGSRVVRSEASVACEIILFPGVRYERWVDQQPVPAQRESAQKKPRMKKRRMELAD